MKWVNYFFSADFSASAAFFETCQKGEVIEGEKARTLCSMLLSADTHGNDAVNWNTQEGQSFSVVGATVVYNGVNKRDFPTNFKFNRVMRLRFSDSQSQPDRDIYLQYHIGES